MNCTLSHIALVVLGATATAAVAAPTTYKVDPEHTYPSFEADHFGGVSLWRGKVTKTSGDIVLDKEAQTGTVDITIDMASIDTGHAKLNGHLTSSDAGMLDVAKFPTARYKGKLVDFKNAAPTKVQGELTLHGVTKPVTLTINSFKCMEHPFKKKQFCGADAVTTINREDFGVNWGKPMGFKMDVKLTIQVEAYPAG
jgi:polyisoprenoid-binding protein YceI